MKKEDFLKAFAEMSAEDRQVILAQLTKAKDSPCCPGPSKQHMMEMMKALMEKGQENPMAMCQEMMRMCQQKMGQLAGKSSP